MLEIVFDLVVDCVMHSICMNKTIKYAVGVFLFILVVFSYINSKKDAFYILTGIFIVYIFYFLSIYFWHKKRK